MELTLIFLLLVSSVYPSSSLNHPQVHEDSTDHESHQQLTPRGGRRIKQDKVTLYGHAPQQDYLKQMYIRQQSFDFRKPTKKITNTPIPHYADIPRQHQVQRKERTVRDVATMEPVKWKVDDMNTRRDQQEPFGGSNYTEYNENITKIENMIDRINKLTLQGSLNKSNDEIRTLWKEVETISTPKIRVSRKLNPNTYFESNEVEPSDNESEIDKTDGYQMAPDSSFHPVYLPSNKYQNQFRFIPVTSAPFYQSTLRPSVYRSENDLASLNALIGQNPLVQLQGLQQLLQPTPATNNFVEVKPQNIEISNPTIRNQQRYTNNPNVSTTTPTNLGTDFLIKSSELSKIQAQLDASAAAQAKIILAKAKQESLAHAKSHTKVNDIKNVMIQHNGHSQPFTQFTPQSEQSQQSFTVSHPFLSFPFPSKKYSSTIPPRVTTVRPVYVPTTQEVTSTTTKSVNYVTSKLPSKKSSSKNRGNKNYKESEKKNKQVLKDQSIKLFTPHNPQESTTTQKPKKLFEPNYYSQQLILPDNLIKQLQRLHQLQRVTPRPNQNNNKNQDYPYQFQFPKPVNVEVKNRGAPTSTQLHNSATASNTLIDQKTANSHHQQISGNALRSDKKPFRGHMKAKRYNYDYWGMQDYDSYQGDDDMSRGGGYAFGYRVKDLHRGSTYGHEEMRDKSGAKGSYHVLLPDGRMQKVDYYSDSTGYHAKVSYEDVGQASKGR